MHSIAQRWDSLAFQRTVYGHAYRMSVEDRKFRYCCLIVLGIVSVNNSYVVHKEKLALRNGSLLVSDPHYLVLKLPSLLN
jgi:hypothetical protein